MNQERNNDAVEDKAFEKISLEDLVLHTLLDMFEFSAHSFYGFDGPYFWNGLGIDFETPMPKEEVLEHAKYAQATTIYVAHTHPLANDDSLTFSDAKVDPREQIAFSHRPLPLGNKPSAGDVAFLYQVKREYAAKNVNAKGVVFSASGVWEYDIPDMSSFNADKFTKAYTKFYPVVTDGFFDEWHARSDFPSYYMEVQKPKMHATEYRTKLTEIKNMPDAASHKDELAKTITFFGKHGVTLNFHPYAELNIQPQTLMRRVLADWTHTFVKR